MQKIYVEFNYIVEEENDNGKSQFEFKAQMAPNTPIKIAKECAYLFLKDLGKIEDDVKARLDAEQSKTEENSSS